MEMTEEQQPVGRFATPEEIAAAEDRNPVDQIADYHVTRPTLKGREKSKNFVPEEQPDEQDEELPLGDPDEPVE